MLLVAEIPDGWMQVGGSAFIGLACAVVGWWLVQALRSDDLVQEKEWRYDVSRTNELRRVDWLYRLFYPVFRGLSAMNRGVFREFLPMIHREIQAAGLPRFWLPEEYLVRCELIAALGSPAIITVCIQQMGQPGVVLGVVLTVLLAYLLRRRLRGLAMKRLLDIKRRMPFLLDLLTLLMEAGSTFLQALEQSVAEFGGHPIAVEFGRVLSDIELGKTRPEAFTALRDRLNDDEITSIIGSILQGEKLGTPLAQIFRTQADVLRLKRSQRAETVAGEAGVNMLLPGVLVMASTIIVILGPFVLNFLYSGFGF